MRKFLLGLLLLTGPALPAAAAEELQTIVVKPGDTLWSISNTYLKDPKRWNELLKYNRLPAADPSIALPGMPLKVPVNLLKEEYRAAKVVYVLNEVLFRRSGLSDWKSVASDMDLYKNDTVRTRVDARADVKFYTGEILNLYPNSIAVLRPPGDKDIDVRLMAGSMRGLRSRVVTASARITPKTKDTEFGAKINDDLTTVVQVYKGKANVEAHGKTVEVSEGFASEVKMDMPPSQPVKLPPLPELDGTATAGFSGKSRTRLTASGGVVSLNMGKPVKTAQVTAEVPKDLGKGPAVPDANDKAIDAGEIVKMISVGNAVQSYHLQVSKNREFTSLALDRSYDAFDEIDLNSKLPPGDYFMRVALIDLLGFEGKFSTPRPIKVGGSR
ncbi:MAG: LysM peptidoglycan-binding domain-containing protein [Elusimicrobia bacterium]|nr:LysM peptidoglycan-binding domain-containing protein [Elusimicrobiota bacterium]